MSIRLLKSKKGMTMTEVVAIVITILLIVIAIYGMTHPDFWSNIFGAFKLG
jgi:hypothetical protein